MHDSLVIIGASGHGKVVADTALNMKKWEFIYFLDDNPKLDEVMGIKVVGKVKDAEQYKKNSDFFVAIGDNDVRKCIQEKLYKEKFSIVNLIHPSALIARGVDIGTGTVVMPGVIINPSTKIGNGCIINTSSVVEHDNIVSDYVHISPGVQTGGNVEIGYLSWLGIGSIVINNIKIGPKCLVGAGAIVINNLEDSGTYVGLPARRKK